MKDINKESLLYETLKKTAFWANNTRTHLDKLLYKIFYINSQFIDDIENFISFLL